MTKQDQYRIAEGYNLPFVRRLEFFINGSYVSTGTICCRSETMIPNEMEIMRRNTAKRHNVPLYTVTYNPLD